VRRAQECGLGTGPGVRDFDRLLAVLLELRLGKKLWIGPAAYTPTSRGRRYEALRPELADLLPLAERVLEVSDARRRCGAMSRRTRRLPPTHSAHLHARRAPDGAVHAVLQVGDVPELVAALVACTALAVGMRQSGVVQKPHPATLIDEDASRAGGGQAGLGSGLRRH
jgi:hypothetical protein